MKSDIRECLASQMIKYKADPSNAECDAAAEALVKKLKGAKFSYWNHN